MKRIYQLIALFVIVSCHAQTQTNQTTLERDSMSNYNPLNEKEAYVILNKGTEAPYTGEYTDNKQEGIYLCRQCNNPLYRSSDKFDSHCGWPSFDDEIEGAVRRVPDSDGMRTEIICAHCEGHLGHVFLGEGFTQKDTRHCVNSISMVFYSTGTDLPPVLGLSAQEKEAYLTVNADSAVLGAGCFWCVDAIFQQLKGVLKVEVGYTGGIIKNPTYKMVCQGNTGHVEVAKIYFDPTVISYETLLDIFFHTHDPTTLNRQGNDIGEQYRSVIYYANEEQKNVAEAVLSRTDSSDLWSDPIVTTIEPLGEYYIAEDYHQDYYNNNTQQPYCSAVVGPKVAKFRIKYSHLLKEDR